MRSFSSTYCLLLMEDNLFSTYSYYLFIVSFKYFLYSKLPKWMKQTFCFLFLFILFSCSKKKEDAPNTVAFISFSADGTAYNWKENIDTRSDNFMSLWLLLSSLGGNYTFYADNTSIDFPHPARRLTFTIPSTTLLINTPYRVTIADNTTFYRSFFVEVQTTLNKDISKIYETSEADDYAIMTFTKIEGKRANGTFMARLTRRSDKSKVEISQGNFENVFIRQ